jgi:uncharacterized protein (UPF0335 family)
MAKRLKPGAKSSAPNKSKAAAKKQAAQESPPSVGHNRAITEADTARAHELLGRLENAKETAVGKIRQAYKDLKDQGHNIKALKEARRRLRQDPLEAQQDFDDYLLYCSLLGVDKSVEQARQQNENNANAASVDAAERGTGRRSPTFSLADVKKLPATHHLRGVYAAGLRAGLEGEECEHSYEDGTDAALIFEGAHKEGLEQRATAARMEPKKNGAEARH